MSVRGGGFAEKTRQERDGALGSESRQVARRVSDIMLEGTPGCRWFISQKWHLYV